MDPWLDRLYRHLAWADGRVLDALEAQENPPEGALKLMAHVAVAEHLWLARIEGWDTGNLGPWTPLSPEACRSLSARTLAGFAELVAGATPERLAARVAYRNTRGEAFETPLGDLLLHVALHGAHHRGQIAALLRGGGLPVPVTDFVIFSREGA